MPRRTFPSLVRILLGAFAIGVPLAPAAHAQWAVIDPTNLIQNALTAARTLEQIGNQVKQITHQIRSLENEARNLERLGTSFAPEFVAQLRELDAILTQAGGVALEVQATRDALEELFGGQYAGTDIAARASSAARMIDASRAALRSTLLVQAKVTEQLRDDQTSLQRLASASANATGALSAQQATNEILAFQAEQSLRLQALLVAQSRAQAIEQAREMEVRAAARAQHEHFFSGAATAHPGPRPWN